MINFEFNYFTSISDLNMTIEVEVKISSEHESNQQVRTCLRDLILLLSCLFSLMIVAIWLTSIVMASFYDSIILYVIALTPTIVTSIAVIVMIICSIKSYCQDSNQEEYEIEEII